MQGCGGGGGGGKNAAAAISFFLFYFEQALLSPLTYCSTYGSWETVRTISSALGTSTSTTAMAIPLTTARE